MLINALLWLLVRGRCCEEVRPGAGEQARGRGNSSVAAEIRTKTPMRARRHFF